MSYAPSRSSLDELHEGVTDGTYRKINKDRGGQVEGTTCAARADLSDAWFGLHEAYLKTVGDGITASTPNYVPTPPASPPYL